MEPQGRAASSRFAPESSPEQAGFELVALRNWCRPRCLNDREPCHAFQNGRIPTAVRQVRIRFPPAESQVQTCLSGEFAFLGREAAASRGCPGPDEWPEPAETRGAREHLAEGRQCLCRALFQYRTAGDEVGGDAADVIADARPAVMSASRRCRAGRSVVAPEKPPSSSPARRQIQPS